MSAQLKRNVGPILSGEIEMKKQRAVLVVLFFLVLAIGARPQNQAPDLARSKVVGTVVARGPFSKVRLVTGQSTTYFRDDLLVRVEKGDDQLAAGDFVRIIYEKSAEEEGALPEPMFEKKKLWTFTLTPDNSCDRVMKDLIFYAHANDKGECSVQQYMQWMPWSAEGNVPLEAKLKCFSFGQSDFAPVEGSN